MPGAGRRTLSFRASPLHDADGRFSGGVIVFSDVSGRREVERFIGRRGFVILYSLLLLVPTLVLTAAGLLAPFGLTGSATVHFGVFLAFANVDRRRGVGRRSRPQPAQQVG